MGIVTKHEVGAFQAPVPERMRLCKYPIICKCLHMYVSSYMYTCIHNIYICIYIHTYTDTYIP